MFVLRECCCDSVELSAPDRLPERDDDRSRDDGAEAEAAPLSAPFALASSAASDGFGDGVGEGEENQPNMTEGAACEQDSREQGREDSERGQTAASSTGTVVAAHSGRSGGHTAIVSARVLSLLASLPAWAWLPGLLAGVFSHHRASLPHRLSFSERTPSHHIVRSSQQATRDSSEGALPSLCRVSGRSQPLPPLPRRCTRLSA